MSLRVDVASWVGGGLQIGPFVGGGVAGSAIPAGSVFLANFVAGDENKEFRAFLTSRPSSGVLTFYEDGTFSFVGAPAGTYTFTYDLYVDYVLIGSNTVTIVSGSSALSGIGGAQPGGVGALVTRVALSGGGGARPGGNGFLLGGSVPLAGAGGAQPGGIGTLASPGALLAGYGGAQAGGIAGIYLGGLATDPRFIVNGGPRVFWVGAPVPNSRSPHMSQVFPSVEKGEKVVLSFDFSDQLAPGQALAGIVATMVTVLDGADGSPAAILSGLNSIAADGKSVQMGAQPMLGGRVYKIVVWCSLNDGSEALAVSGTLPVMSV